MKTQFYYLHIPKCGGTTFKKFVFKLFGKDKVWRVWPGESSDLTDDSFRELTIEALSKRRAVVGHLPAKDFFEKLSEQDVARYYCCTIIREPIARFLSLWNYRVQQEDRTVDSSPAAIKKFADGQKNAQCWWICGEYSAQKAVEQLEQYFDAVVTLDQLAILYKHTLDHFGGEPANFQSEMNLKKNVSNKILTRSDLSEALVEYITAQNQEDRQLYEAIQAKGGYLIKNRYTRNVSQP